ncbi:MAG: transcriptional regulator, MarR family [Frankiales bacterium]|nr:transcriptional regulator, MarR family [Frankiales bacterium]
MSTAASTPAGSLGGSLDAVTKWLTEDEQRAWVAWLGASELLMTSLDAQLQRDAGFPHAYYAILAQLSAAPDRTLRMSDLASVVNASPSRLSHAVGKLEERGWVIRRTCPSDRRGMLATLTDVGFAVLAEQAPGHVAAVRKGLLDPLTDEQVAQLEQICNAILDGLDPSRSRRLLA